MKVPLCLLAAALSLPLLFHSPITAQVESEGPEAASETVRFYMDCNVLPCFDLNYFRREVPFVSWVQEPQDAEVYLLITAQMTGAGGMRSELIFIGQDRFDGMADTLSFIAVPNSSMDAQRTGLVRMLKIGLMRYVGLTPLAQDMEIGLRIPKVVGEGLESRSELAPENDPWDYWVFSVAGRGSLSGETVYSSRSFSGSLTANRVTEAWKLNLRVSSSYSETDYESDAIPLNVRRDHNFNGTVIKSVAGHWSAGVRLSARSSTYYNYDFSGSISPMVEYSLFPYEESSRRSASIQYTLDAIYSDYREETIYFKDDERFLAQSLSFAVGYTQPWGNAYGSIGGGHQLHDWEKHHGTVSGGMTLRLSRGISLNLSGRYSRVHDRISVAAGADDTPQDVLLRRRQFQTDYTYRTSIGLTYRFGSLFNNVVNPRFDGPGGIMIMF